jgi:thiol-disulfide isomerase/thioredoxin
MGKIEKKGKKWKLADAIESSRREREGYSYATCCGPCQMMVPVLEQVGIQLRDRLDYQLYTDKIRIDRNYFLQKRDAKYADFLPVSPEFPTVNSEFLIAFSQY